MLFAGSAAVVGSLWGVLDNATAELMTALYKGWRDHGLSPAEALHLAQLSLLHPPQPASELPTKWEHPLRGDTMSASLANAVVDLLTVGFVAGSMGATVGYPRRRGRGHSTLAPIGPVIDSPYRRPILSP
jgi:CHAT domain-containing protein